MESIIHGYLNERFLFLRFYPEEIITNEPAVYYINSRILSRDYFIEQSNENIRRFIDKYNQLEKFEFSSKKLKTIAANIFFEHKSLLKYENKSDLENLIQDVIVNNLSIKVGFNRIFKKLFDLGRVEIKDITPKKITSRVLCEAEIGEIVYVCVNNEEPYVSSPGIVLEKKNTDYVILYYTNFFGGRESKLLEINNFNFNIFDNRNFGKTRIQSIENKKNN